MTRQNQTGLCGVRAPEPPAGLRPLRLALVLVALVGAARFAPGARRAHGAEFRFAGGTQYVSPDCAGRLELSSAAMTYRCAQFAIRIPYSAIRIMEYRPDLSRRIRRLKLKWQVRPSPGGGKRNRYFTIVYADAGLMAALVLEIAPDQMRPYLAEIDLKAGRRVNVMSHESYE